MPHTVEDLVALFDILQVGDLKFRGPQPDTYFQRLFGGQVLAQTLWAAMQTVPDDRPVHSLHAYFLRPGSPNAPLRFEVDDLRNGRTFSARRVVTRQGDDEIFQLNCSFQLPEPGLDHSAKPPTDVSAPEDCPPLRGVLEEQFGSRLHHLSEWDALDVRLASEPRPSDQGGVMRAWVRTQTPLPDDGRLHAAVAAYLSDITLLSVSTVQHELAFMSPGLQAASVDHAMWFHRPFRSDEWLLYDMISPSTSGARGFCKGSLYQDGLLVASCAQEGLIRVG
ncbi:acyl-CoA thioesterase II [Tessaracoccus sp. OS52]|uniref:acyl-CoA thioesterase n=1 Tax=Tessaracoccus sp. OS52 TaxID=2886691 RepID=UPI001D11CDC3|nr:acyl-CoA thioesterase II [Tessaracoccus sp. OS52]